MKKQIGFLNKIKKYIPLDTSRLRFQLRRTLGANGKKEKNYKQNRSSRVFCVSKKYREIGHMKKQIALLFLLHFIPTTVVAQSLVTILIQYENALKDLIQSHQATTPSKPIVLQQGSIIFATYQKIIAPYVTYIKGYANVVQSEQARNLAYHDDLKKLSQEFVKYQKEVQRIAKLFPVAQQPAVLQAFNEEIGAPVVQICFNIVQQISYALTVDPGSLASCYIAYQLALGIYVPGMVISGVATGSTLSASLTSAMTSLYQAAIAARQAELNTGLTHEADIQDVYQEIEAYLKILSVVYLNAGNGAQSSTMLQQVQAVQLQAQAYAQALSLYTQAQTVAKKSRTVVILDPLQPAQVASSLSVYQQESAAALGLFQKAQTAYESAIDPLGQQRCAQAISTVQNIDTIVRFLEQQWLLYVTDQSSNNVMTAPTIASFIQANNGSSVTVQDVEQALQNLIAVIAQSTNNVNQLATQSQLQQYSVTTVINLLEQNILDASSSTVMVDPLVSLEAVSRAQIVLKDLQNMSQAIVDAIGKTDTNSVALAMTYAQQLDKLFVEKNILTSLIPYFPSQLSQGATWTDWVAAILVAAQVVATKAQAYAQIGKAKITQPAAASVVDIQKTIAQAKALQATAAAAAHANNFAIATTNYQQAFTAYQSIYAAQPESATAAQWYQQAMLMRTLFSASSFASTVQASGSVTWKKVALIPTSYVATEYQFSQLNMADFGNAVLPASLQTLSTGTSITTVTPEQQKDIFALIRAYMVNQLLMPQGINFTDCFVDYRLSFQPNIVANAKTFAQQVMDQVKKSMHAFAGSTIISITVQDASTVSSVNCSNMPLSPVTPFFATMATATTFLESAYTLFAPGTQDISLGGTQYVPGNQAAVADAILEEMVYGYLAEGYRHWIEAQKLMASLHPVAAPGKEATQVKLPANFSDTFRTVQKNMIRAQALLYAPDQSAYAYAQKSANGALSAAVQELFFDLYGEMISWMKQCLVGDPFSANYQMLLHQINATYMNWASMLDPVKDKDQINKFNGDIAQLFEKAGMMCMKTSYEEPRYPGYQQMHYATAAHYFLAAQKQYTALNQTQNADQMAALMRKAYYQGSCQNIALYFYVKKHGVSYSSSETGQVVAVSVAQMAQDNQTGFVDAAEQDAYSAVKNLLLNAGLGFDMLGNQTTKPAAKSASAVSAPVAKIGKTAKAKQQPSKIILYLRTKNIIDATTLEIPYDQQGIIQKIFAVAADAYKKFEHDPVTVENWVNTLLHAVQTLYAQDYMGVQGTQTGAQEAAQTQAFFQALQKETSSLENPSSAYIG